MNKIWQWIMFFFGRKNKQLSISTQPPPDIKIQDKNFDIIVRSILKVDDEETKNAKAKAFDPINFQRALKSLVRGNYTIHDTHLALNRGREFSLFAQEFCRLCFDRKIHVDVHDGFLIVKGSEFETYLQKQRKIKEDPIESITTSAYR